MDLMDFMLTREQSWLVGQIIINIALVIGGLMICTIAVLLLKELIDAWVEREYS